MFFTVLRHLLPWLIAIILLGLFILWLILSVFFTFPYAYTLNTIYTCWGIGITVVLLVYGLLIYINGWRSFFKNFWVSLSASGIVGLSIGASLFYLSWLSLVFTQPQVTTVQVLAQYYSGGRNGCMEWKVRLPTGETLRPFCTHQTIQLQPNATFAQVTLKRNWLVTEVNYSPSS